MYRLKVCGLVIAALAMVMAAATSGCASTAKKAGRAAATTSVQGAKAGARATVSGAQAVGSTAVGTVTRGR